MNILDKGIAKLDVNSSSDSEEVKSLKEFTQTIVAYRKYYGDINWFLGGKNYEQNKGKINY